MEKRANNDKDELKGEGKLRYRREQNIQVKVD